jgi:hypothetical protein
LTETFLILLAGGIMLAAAISDPKQVDLRWLRLCGVIALCLAGVGVYFTLLPKTWRDREGVNRYIALGCLILLQMIFAQLGRQKAQRICAALAALVGIEAGGALSYYLVRHVSQVTGFSRIQWRLLDLQALLAAASIAATSGLSLMDMLLGHAYLTAAKMTIAPFRRLNIALAFALAFSAACSVAAVVYQHHWPIEQFWNRYTIYLGTRWLVGLLLPAIFVYMAHDCIKRRSTQSATGILYVAGVLIFIGEIIALYLLRETGLPF